MNAPMMEVPNRKVHITGGIVFSLILLIGLGLFQGTDQATAAEGTLVREVVHSPALEGNLLGDSPDRQVTVYLPPGYEEHPDTRYPVIYLLHGYTGTDRLWIGFDYLDFNIRDITDPLIDQKTIQPMIIIMPNANNQYWGSCYTNSSVTGNWEDFIVTDLVNYVDSNYRTLSQPTSRGIAGHSMGGYGAMTLAMRHPEIYSAVYAMSGGSFAIVDREGSNLFNSKVGAEVLRTNDFMTASFFAKRMIAFAAALTPNADNPPLFIDLPYELVNDEVRPIEERWNQWRARTPLGTINEYLASPVKLRNIAFDVGRSDGYPSIPPDNQAFSAGLTQAGIPHLFEEYEGDHSNRIRQRLETHVLPFFSTQFSQGRAGIQVLSVTPIAGVGISGQPIPVDMAVTVVGPSTVTGEFPTMRVDLSPLGLEETVLLTPNDTGVYRSSAPITAPQSGRYMLPVQVQHVDGDWGIVDHTALEVYPGENLMIFAEGLAPDWQLDVTRQTVLLNAEATEFVFQGVAASAFQVTPEGARWAVELLPEAAMKLLGYTALGFAFHPGDVVAPSRPRFNVRLDRVNINLLEQVDLDKKEWQVVELPLEAFELKEAIPKVEFGGNLEGTFYLDDLRLVAVEPPMTAVLEAHQPTQPQSFTLDPNYPNPFNSGTVIDFALPQGQQVELAVYNLIGQQVASLVDGPRPAGTYTVRWDGRDDDGQALASGVYLYRLQAGDGQQVQTRKLLLLR